jgi:hypothetical protein
MPNGKKVKVPFLNGGLFDKEKYDEATLTIPATLFHHPDLEEIPLTEKNRNHARGFLDFLDAFNFTVHEDSPDDHTVAVDPEMLGHIFENLLEDNKDKGAFYTPKEIVHYMCQESLTEYCLNHDFTDSGITMMDDDKRKLIESIIKKKEIDTELLKKSSQSEKSYATWLRQLEKALDHVKICDPAIGSGAFPMGLLQEIHAIKEVIAYELQLPWKPAEVKENIIQNSIYGVDIEKGAVDIARLRFWLSLVVDEEKPRALPNLDYKIVVGNSLVSKFEDEIIEIDWEIKEGTQANIFGNENVLKRQELLKKITAKQQEYFHATDKQKLAEEIRNLKIDILINQLELMINTKGLDKKPSETGKKAKAQMELWLQTQGWKNAIAKLQKLKQNKEEPFEHFDWKLDFPEVLNPYLVNENTGFDIVIGNPPYISIRTKDFNNSFKPYFKNKFSLAVGQYDLFTLFIEKSHYLLSGTGILSFIIPKKILTNENFEEARKFLLKNIPIRKYVDAQMPFASASVEANVIISTRVPVQKVKTYLFNGNSIIFKFDVDISLIHLMPFQIFPFAINPENVGIISKILRKCRNKLGDYLNVIRGMECGFNHPLISKSKSKHKIIRGEHLSKYVIYETDYYVKPDFSDVKVFKSKEIYLNVPKILTKFVSNSIDFSFDTVGYFNTNVVYNLHPKPQNENLLKYFLALGNSKLVNFWFFNTYVNDDKLFPHIQKNQLDSIPVIIPKDKSSIEKIVDQILSAKATNPNADTSTLEKQIDELVYKLYELTYEEVKVIDPAFPLSKEEYDKIQLE